MEFLEINLINTLTQIDFSSNTILGDNLLNRDPTKQWISSGFAGASTTTLTISFDATVTIDRIALLSHNWKSFDMFYNGATANTFAFTTTSSTNTSQFTTNSETSQFFRATSVDVTSVTIDIKDTILSTSEKAIGHLLLTTSKLDFPRIPSAKGYKPQILPKQVVHRLSDGGTRIQTVQSMRRTDIKFKNITSSFRDSLKVVYEEQNPFWFVAFGTATSWDELIFESVWEGGFEFFRYSDNAVSAGHEGSIKLRETPL